MKKIIALVMSVLTLLSLGSIFSYAENVNTDTDLTNERSEPKDEKVLPSSTTLVGSKDLPPVMNQGSIGCCASAAITYMQFTNAISRNIREFHPEIKFEPATGEKQYLFSPKWTYDLSGSGTAWVYNILSEMGCLTQDRVDFYRHPKTGACLSHQHNRPSKYMTQSTGWNLNENQAEDAFNYRINHYDQVWISKAPYLVDGKVAYTTTEEGRALHNRIKETINDGNVVVTGGFIGAWKFSDDAEYRGKIKVTNPGKLGKTDDVVLPFSRGKETGGHQVCIVGYDDDFTITYRGETIKGAYQMVNSWGTEWKNDGFVWVMYDALNEVSEFAELNFPDRVMSIDQFCFIDWRKDISLFKMPELYIDVEVEAKNRNDVNILPMMENTENGDFMSKTPYVFRYTHYHPKYDEIKNKTDYFNFDGIKNGDFAKAKFSLDFSRVYDFKENPDASKVKFQLMAFSGGGEIRILSVKLKNSYKQVVAEIPVDKGGDVIIDDIKEYSFDASLVHVVMEGGKGEGYSFGAVDGYFTENMKVPVTIQEEEGYVYDEMQVKDQNGNLLQKDENGAYLLPVQENMKISSVTGIKKAEKPEPPVPTPTPDEQPTPEESKDSSLEEPGTEDSKQTNVGLIVAIVVVVVLVAGGITAFVIVKKKK